MGKNNLTSEAGVQLEALWIGQGQLKVPVTIYGRATRPIFSFHAVKRNPNLCTP